MLTSESSNIEFQQFFNNHYNELYSRLNGLLKNKYRRAILSLLKKGEDIPPIWGMLKLPEATLYMLPIGIKPAKGDFQVTSTSCFMVMKDLKEQTPVVIANSKPHVVMFSSHAVRRYKERIGLDSETEFVDVVKHMFVNGCSRPRILGDMSKIHGTSFNHRSISIVSMNGTFMGYADGNTEVMHAETFLSSKELKDDQLFLNASKSEDLLKWKKINEAYAKGDITVGEFESQLQKLRPSGDIAFSNGRIIELTPEEARLRNEENRKAITDPDLIKKAIEENRQKYNNKVRRKGYK